MTHARDWNSSAYERVAAPVMAFGQRLLEGLELRGDEVVLDAGCGDGRVTKMLAERVPRGRVIGVDASPSMVDAARATLGEVADVRQADLVELELDEPVELVFSSATFHWIADHDRLFARLFAALRPGGRLLAQCGGQGNIATVVTALDTVTGETPFARHFAGWGGPWNFAGPDQTVARLERAGFVDARARLHVEPVRADDPREYLGTMILGAHLDRLPAEVRGAFVERVMSSLDDPGEIEYVRLTMSARRPD
jgi:trans-aconitate 2-methyltransferase